MNYILEMNVGINKIVCLLKRVLSLFSYSISINTHYRIYNSIFISCNSWIKEKNYFYPTITSTMDLMFVWLLRHHIGVGATNTTINK